jgi:hypothetical protein
MQELAPLAMQFEPRLELAIHKWHELTPWQRRFVTLDDLAAEAGVRNSEFLAAIVWAGFEFTHHLTDLLVACSFPSVVAASVKRAKTPNGIADRQLLYEHMSALSMKLALEQAADKARRSAEKNAHAVNMDNLSQSEKKQADRSRPRKSESRCLTARRTAAN